MPIGPRILLRLVKEKKLVENLSERELTNPEGAGFDLRLGEVYSIKGNAYLGVDERKTPDTQLLMSYDPNKKQSLILKHGDFYLVKTIEAVNLPEDIGAVLFTRGTIFRSGVVHMLSQIAPGYSGGLITGLYNVGPSKVEIELGARFMHVTFDYVHGGGSKYRGQWQGGRVWMRKREKQV